MYRESSTTCLERKIWCEHGIFLAAFIPVAALLFWKCRFGFADNDEAFYLAIPFRLCQGDSLFVEEWHLSQMSGALLYPFVWLYASLNKSLDGIILAARYLYTVLQCFVGLFLYIRLRKINWCAAVVATISFTLYVPFGIMALSYNSMGLMWVMLGLVILFTAGEATADYFFAGVFFAFAVLCCPFILLEYLVYGLVVCANSLSGRKMFSDSCFRTQNFLYVTLGAAVIAVVFLGFALSRTSVDKMVQAIPAMLQDPSHPLEFVEKIPQYFESILRPREAGRLVKKALQASYLALAGLFLLCLCDKRRKTRKTVYFLGAATVTLLIMALHSRFAFLNLIMWPVNTIAPFVALLSSDEKIRRVFRLIWLPGILYSFCIHLGSNQTYYAITSAGTVATVGSIVILILFAAEARERRGTTHPFWRSPICLVTALMLLVLLSSETYLRYKHIFWDTDVETQIYLIEEGIESGLYVSEEKYRLYNNAMEDLNILKKYEPEKVLYLSSRTWLYLSQDYELASYSAWTPGSNEKTIDRLKLYYSQNPHKLPDTVYVERGNEENAERFCREFDYVEDKYDRCLILIPNTDKHLST